jgi:heme-degrading monooxygenase HmoA
MAAEGAAESAAAAALGGAIQPGYCVRVVPYQVKSGALSAFLEAHRAHHTPVVRRQPGFVSKLLLRSEEQPDRLVMVLTWRTAAQANAWRALPEHDASGRPVAELLVRSDATQSTPRGGYTVLDAIVGETGG